ATQVRPAVGTPSRVAPPTSRTRPPTGSHRPPPPRRGTFSPGQKALMWAAAVLGIFAIIIAALILLRASEQKNDVPLPSATTPSSEAPSSPASASPGALAPANIVALLPVAEPDPITGTKSP
ncbi:MAG: serine/threonine protein kinase, partial [[Mycobacterium] stephanolepidis]